MTLTNTDHQTLCTCTLFLMQTSHMPLLALLTKEWLKHRKGPEESLYQWASTGQLAHFWSSLLQLGKGRIVKPMSNDNGENEKVKNMTSFSREAAQAWQ